MGDQGAGRREARGREGAESRAAWGGAVNGREAQRERPVGRRRGGQKEGLGGAPAPLLRNTLLNAGEGRVGLGPVGVLTKTTAELVRAIDLPWFTDRKGTLPLCFRNSPDQGVSSLQGDNGLVLLGAICRI